MMNKLTTLLLTTILLIFLPSFKEITNSNNKNSSLNVISFKDSILVFKSDSRELVEFDSNKNPLSNITENINYHIINFDTNEIILFFKLAKDNKWSSQSFKYYSTKEDRETIEFDTNSNLSLKVYLDINPYSSIIYSFKNGTILNFTDLKISEMKIWMNSEFMTGKILLNQLNIHEKLLLMNILKILNILNIGEKNHSKEL